MRLVRFALGNPDTVVTAIISFDTAEIALLHAVGGITAASLLGDADEPTGAEP